MNISNRKERNERKVLIINKRVKELSKFFILLILCGLSELCGEEDFCNVYI
jgi:hypothetical protein